MLFAATATTSSQSSITSLLFPVLLVVGAYFLFIRPRAQAAKRTQAQGKDVEVGDRVITTSGMLGRISRMTDETVIVEVAPDVEISFVRRAISRRIDDSDPLASPSDAAAPEEAESTGSVSGGTAVDQGEAGDGSGETSPEGGPKGV